MAQLPPLISFTAGSPAVAGDVNQNFTDIRDHLNGANVDTENIAATLLSRSGGPILNLSQLTENQIAFNVENSQTNTAVSISQLALLATGKSILKLSETVAQTQGDAQLFLSLQALSTIPAIYVTHGGVDSFKLTKDGLKPPTKTTAQRNSTSPDEGSVIYNSTNQELNIKQNSKWVPVGCPVGSLLMYAGATAPEGWLLCIGSAVPNGSGTIQGITADFSILYSIVGATLPDLRGRIPLGKDDMGGSSANRVTNAQADTLLGSQGSETIAVTELPNHTHIYSDSYFPENNIPGQGSRMPQDCHATPIPENKGVQGVAIDNDNVGWSIYKTSDMNFSRNNGSFNTVTSSNLAGNPHMPPYQTFNYIIKY